MRMEGNFDVIRENYKERENITLHWIVLGHDNSILLIGQLCLFVFFQMFVSFRCNHQGEIKSNHMKRKGLMTVRIHIIADREIYVVFE